MLELNDVLVEGAEKTVSMMAQERKVTCLTGGSPLVRSRLLLAMMGLEPLKSGFVCIDGEPLGKATSRLFRRMMAYVPSELRADGEVVVYEPPTVQEVFGLKDNRDAAISNGLLSEEMKRTMAPDDKAQLLAVAVLRQRPILLVDSPHPLSATYLHRQAEGGRLVIVSSDDTDILRMADEIMEI
jgi:ABC-type cobalamin/Fe3+-siderophores transport system ATPase subunit